MSTTCKFEQCEAPATMGTRQIHWTAHTTGHKWYADIPMCDECYDLLTANTAEHTVCRVHWKAVSQLPESKRYCSKAAIQRIAHKH